MTTSQPGSPPSGPDDRSVNAPTAEGDSGPADQVGRANAIAEHDRPDDASPGSTLRATRACVKDRHRPLLPPTSLEITTGELLVGHGDATHAHTALALALGGRLHLDAGAVDIDGDSTARGLRRRVALVDVPGVSDPDDLVPTTTVVGEELAVAGHRARRRDVHAWLTEHGYAALAGTTIEQVPGVDRVTLLATLAALRPVDFLVLVLPERHGVLPSHWLPALQQLATAGPGIVVTASTGIAAHVPPHVQTVAFGVLEETPA